MSGGSFDYLYHKLDDEPFDPKVERELTAMIAALSADDGGYLKSVPNAAGIRAELLALKMRLKYLQSLALKDAACYTGLAQAIEWYASSDWGTEPIEREYHKLLGIKDKGASDDGA
jgi:hypothetical protein